MPLLRYLLWEKSIIYLKKYLYFYKCTKVCVSHFYFLTQQHGGESVLRIKRCSSDPLIISIIYTSPRSAPYLSRVTSFARYHGLTQIQPYTWSITLTLTPVSGVVYAIGRYPYSVYGAYLFTVEHSFWHRSMSIFLYWGTRKYT